MVIEEQIHGAGSGLVEKRYGCEPHDKCCFCLPIKVRISIIAVVSIFLTAFNVAQIIMALY
jgi:hypothetical protein